VCGLDLMSIDISKPWFENGAVINEVNFKPFFGGDLKNDRGHPYLESMLPKQGRIPIHAILGDGDLWSAARNVAKLLSETNTLVTITDASVTELSTGEELHLSSNGLFNRCRALLQNRMLDALVVIVNSDEFGQTGLPFDEISQLHLVGGEEESMQNIQKMLPKIAKSQDKI
jgi:cyanophycin synthetase